MKILILCPSLNPHGGVRVIVEWANGLARRGHDVALFVQHGRYQDWITIDGSVGVQYGGHWSANDYEVVIATTPPLALDLDSRRTPARKFYLLQMAEHLFSSPNNPYSKQAIQSYNVKMPIIGISRWVETVMKREFGRTAPTYYIGNGVSSHFKPGGKRDKGLTVVVADWEGYNHAKDVQAIGPRVAQALKEEYGARIIGWSSQPLATMKDTPDEYYHRVSTEKLVEIYQRATFVIKASMYDARSTAPVEAMACGVPTARAIYLGDDDLYHGINAFVCGYNYEELLGISRRMAEDENLRKRLSDNGLEYRGAWLSWDYWLGIVEEIVS